MSSTLWSESAFGVVHKARDHKKGAKRGALIGLGTGAAATAATLPRAMKSVYTKPTHIYTSRGMKRTVGTLAAGALTAPFVAAGAGTGAAIGTKKKKTLGQ